MKQEEAAVAIIKSDKIGRQQISQARRERLLNEFERSGLSAPEFVKLAGLKYSTFAAWVHRRRQPPKSPPAESAKPVDPVQWLEAVVETAQASQAGTVLVLRLPGDVRMEVADEKQAALAAMVVRALAKPC
jgi:hypothetical protein